MYNGVSRIHSNTIGHRADQRDKFIVIHEGSRVTHGHFSLYIPCSACLDSSHIALLVDNETPSVLSTEKTRNLRENYFRTGTLVNSAVPNFVMTGKKKKLACMNRTDI